MSAIVTKPGAAARPLRAFAVKVRTADGRRLEYPSLAPSSTDAVIDAINRHGICRASAKPGKQ